ncbi:MAG: glycosyltransferase family 2 protein [Akkermansia sp.]|nr:glycosyltransferase family 2 protein [Akkermansia sp.]
MKTAALGGIIGTVSSICAIFNHTDNTERTLSCLSRLAQQSRRPEHVVIVNYSAPDSPALQDIRNLAEQTFSEGQVHLIQSESSAEESAQGFLYAIETLNADFVWVLSNTTLPRPRTLENLLAEVADDHTVRISTFIDPAAEDELSRPLIVLEGSEECRKGIIHRADLPAGNAIPCRGRWLGALYPRSIIHGAGIPDNKLFINGENEEYPWKAKAAGYKFITVLNSELESPAASRMPLHYHFLNRSFIYEPGLPISRQYYKNRNWAWLRRLRAQRCYIRRLVACGLFIGLSLLSKLRCRELGIRRVYNLFRALHHGFYGKLRPY